MPLKLKKSVKQLLAEANAEVETVSAEQSLKLKDDPNVVLVDIRDIRELDATAHPGRAACAPRDAGILGRSGEPLLQGYLRFG